MQKANKNKTQINFKDSAGHVWASFWVPAMSVEGCCEFQEAWAKEPAKPTSKDAYVEAWKRAYMEVFTKWEATQHTSETESRRAA